MIIAQQPRWLAQHADSCLAYVKHMFLPTAPLTWEAPSLYQTLSAIDISWSQCFCSANSHYCVFIVWALLWEKTAWLTEVQRRGLWRESRSFSKHAREEEWKTGKRILKNALCKISLNFWPRVTDSNTGSKARPAVQSIIRRKIKYWSCLVLNRETKTQRKEIKWRGNIFYMAKIFLYLQCDTQNELLS